jgi:hypothetical protein
MTSRRTWRAANGARSGSPTGSIEGLALPLEDEEAVAQLAALVGVDEGGYEVELGEVVAFAVAVLPVGALADELSLGGTPGLGGLAAHGSVGAELPAEGCPLVEEGVEASSSVIGGVGVEAECGARGRDAGELAGGDGGIEAPDAAEGTGPEGQALVRRRRPGDRATTLHVAACLEEVRMGVGHDHSGASLLGYEPTGGADEAAGIEHAIAGLRAALSSSQRVASIPPTWLCSPRKSIHQVAWASAMCSKFTGQS